ncbi:MAG: hypothetical protein AAB570_01645, partial [Patescibacteria group bacterium]
YISRKKNLMNTKSIQWVLRVAVAGEFIGHGVFALQGKPEWVGWFAIFGISNVETATTLLLVLGLLDVALAILVLVKPIRLALLWMAFWGFWTALMRPIVGMPVWDFIERWANWGAPLALLLLMGWPKKAKEWIR